MRPNAASSELPAGGGPKTRQAGLIDRSPGAVRALSGAPVRYWLTLPRELVGLCSARPPSSLPAA